MQKTTINILIIAGSLIIIAFIFSNMFGISSAETITSTGHSTLEVMPDYVVVYFNIETRGSTSNDAQMENEKIVKLFADSMISLGLTDEDLQTQNLNVYPEYDWSNNEKRNLIGYVANHQIKIRIPANDTKKTGQIIDNGIYAGAEINYINYELSIENQNKYKAEVIKDATKDAKIKAEAMAEGAGKKLGSIVSISSSDFNYVPWIAYESIGAKDDSSVMLASSSINPSLQEISSQVNAIFRIK